MAWLDDRIWAHPKLTECSDAACWVWVKGIAYSSGMATRGVLTRSQQALIGSNPKVRRELEKVGLWEDEGADVKIRDWALHNDKRDERRRKDRERKRLQRMREAGLIPPESPQDVTRTVTGLVRGTEEAVSAGLSAENPQRRPHAEGSEGSDGPRDIALPSEKPSFAVSYDANGERATEADVDAVLAGLPPQERNEP